jgi:hypothetical protein
MRVSVRHSRLLLLVLCIAGLTGCIPFVGSGGVDREVDAPYDQVLRATIDVLEARGFPLKTVDPEAGRIVTGRRPVQAGRPSVRPVEAVDVRLERIDDARVEVGLLLTFRDQASGGRQSVPDRDGDGDPDVVAEALDRSFDAEAEYEAYFEAIEARVQALRGAAREKDVSRKRGPR